MIGRGVVDKRTFALGFDGQAGVHQVEKRVTQAEVSTREDAQRCEHSWRTQEASGPNTRVEDRGSVGVRGGVGGVEVVEGDREGTSWAS